MFYILTNKSKYSIFETIDNDDVKLVYDIAVLKHELDKDEYATLFLLDSVLRNIFNDDDEIATFAKMLKRVYYTRVIYISHVELSQRLVDELVNDDICDLHVVDELDLSLATLSKLVDTKKTKSDFAKEVTVDEPRKVGIITALNTINTGLSIQSDEKMIEFFRVNTAKISKLISTVIDVVRVYNDTETENAQLTSQVEVLKAKLNELSEASATIDSLRLTMESELDDKNKIIEHLEADLREAKENLAKALTRIRESGSKIDTSTSINVGKEDVNIGTLVYLKIFSDVRYLKTMLTMYKEYCEKKGQKVRYVIIEQFGATANMLRYTNFTATDSGTIDESLLHNKDLLLVREPRLEIMQIIFKNLDNYDKVFIIDNTRVNNNFLIGRGVKKIYASNSKTEILKFGAPITDTIGYTKGCFEIECLDNNNISFSSSISPQSRQISYRRVLTAFDEFLDGISSSVIGV